MSSAQKVLLLGSGGREHAIAWKLSQSSKVRTIYVAPGNGGTALEGSKIINVDLLINNLAAVSAWCHQEHISLIVVGPEAPLADGITDFLQRQQLPCFGPCKAAAKIEWDKCYGKQLMQKCNIPTAKWESFTEPQQALNYIASLKTSQYVIKANGLAAGKGVTICQSQKAANEAVHDILIKNKFHEKKVIIEEYLQGDEISVLSFCDGENVSIMPFAHDYKRLYDGDLGPNTGGMGAFAPYQKVSHEVVKFIRNEIVIKIVSLMKELGHPYIGVLYTGIIITDDGPKVLEFNCRFGDPEAQVLLRLLKNDLYEIMNDCINQQLDDRTIQWHPDSVVGVVLAGSGYPGPSETDFPIHGINQAINVTAIKIFHAATTIDSNQTKDNCCRKIITKKGRVMTVTAQARNIQLASTIVYGAIKLIFFNGMIYRRDIADHLLPDNFRVQLLTYKESGVDIDAGNDLAKTIKTMAEVTARPGCNEEIGGFSALLNYINAGYQNPSIILTTDGVGTKLMICQEVNNHDTIGIDLVAMSVNDLLARGAEAIAFLDYISYSVLDRKILDKILAGIVNGCSLAGCSLVGGESAQMPGLYSDGRYDLAGFAVGLVEHGHCLPKTESITPGDTVIGIASSGIHSNGFSLIKRIVQCKQLSYDMPSPFLVKTEPVQNDSISLGQALLYPTKIYCKSLLPVLRSSLVKAYAHITGGGLIDNVSRVLPKHCKAVIDARSWKIQDVFKWISNEGNISADEMMRTFNCGIGAILICDERHCASLMKLLVSSGEEFWLIGRVDHYRMREPRVIIHHLDKVLCNRKNDIALKTVSASVSSKLRIAIFISGSGTNMQAIVNYTRMQNSRAEVTLIISNVDKVVGLERAKQCNIEYLVIDHKSYATREEFENEIQHALKGRAIDLICLAGFMRILTSQFVNQWKGKLLNIHPSLLPSFPGHNAIQQAIRAGVKVTGCTVHFVEVEVDSGPIIAQESVPILPHDTEQSLMDRIKAAEHRCYPYAIDLIIEDQVRYINGKLFWL